MKAISELKPLVVGVGGPVGTGKTTIVEKLCKTMSSTYDIAVVTNDIYCKEDAAILTRLNALDPQRIIGVETGACPHQAIRDDVSANLEAIETLIERFPNVEIIFVESGGDNLAASFSPELVDVELYVIDVSGGEKIPRKGGPGIMNSDLLIINKIDIAQYVGSSLEVMERDSKMMRGERPFIMTDMYSGKGLGALQDWISTALRGKQEGKVREAKPVFGHSHLPARYQNLLDVNPSPMEAAELLYDAEGRVAWDEIWGSFCDLALAGGPAHRGSLLEPVAPERNNNPAAYEAVYQEIARGIAMVTNLPTCKGALGWIGVECKSEAMALWMLRAIVAENISVRREGAILFVPLGADFRLEYEIKNIVTVFAKTHHYWQEHQQKR